MALTRDLYAEEHEQFRDIVREFVERHAKPNAARWEAEG